jgi:ATP-dependent RNA helicase RhlE
MTNFKNLNLNEKILGALEKKGYTDPTPIQLQAIPHVLDGKDLLGIAQTGTGKTAAFSLPILHNLAKNSVSAKSGCMRVLILTPTRELASQIAENIELYGKDLGLRYTVIFGGVGERPQIAAMQRGVDILIATPGRLLDLTNQGYIRYMQLEVLVLDEADRMLDMGFINDIKKIIQKIPEKRQTLFFSATMPTTIADLAGSILKNPVKVEVTPQSTTVEKIDQKVLFVEKSNKPSLLKRIVKDEAATSVLVFCRTKHGANKVVEFLEKSSISVEAIHGNKSQSAREKALGQFRASEIKVLVATDIAARGIDIPAISHVINYDIPMDPESYVHRIGRTARAGRTGIAISFCDPSEVKLLREVEKVIKTKIPVDDTHPFHGVEAVPAHRTSFESRDRDSERRSSAPRSREGSYSRAPRSGGRVAAGASARRSEPRRDSRSTGERTARDNSPRDNSRDNSEKKIFGFFGFGKKKSDSHSRPRREEGGLREGGRTVVAGREERRPTRDGLPHFADDSKKKSFGFGWFKKSDSGFATKRPERSGDRRRANPDFVGSRARSGSDSERQFHSAVSGAGSSGARRPSSGGSRSGFGASRPSGSSRSSGGSRDGGKRF